MVRLKPKCTSLIWAAEALHLVQRQGLTLTMPGVAEIVEVARLGELEEIPQLVRVVSTPSVVASEAVAKA